MGGCGEGQCRRRMHTGEKPVRDACEDDGGPRESLPRNHPSPSPSRHAAPPSHSRSPERHSLTAPRADRPALHQRRQEPVRLGEVPARCVRGVGAGRCACGLGHRVAAVPGVNVPCVIVAATRTRWPQARMFLALHGHICCRWRPAVFPLTPSLHHSLTCSRAFLCTIPPSLGPAEFFGELYCPEPGAVREGDGAVLPDANALIPSKVRGRVGLHCLAYQSRRATLTPSD